MGINATILKFGYPQTLVREYEHWLVLARPAQVTLGSLVLAARGEATAYGQLPPAAFAEQGQIVAAVEAALARFVGYERINYLMLMMVDPNVHFHIIPRYSEARSWRGLQFADNGWPGPPDLKSAAALEGDLLEALRDELKLHFY